MTFHYHLFNERISTRSNIKEQRMNNTDNLQPISGSGEPTLYHYTTFFGLSGMTSSKVIWCSKIHYLNDIGELRHGLEYLTRVCSDYVPDDMMTGIKERARSFNGINVFVCSFSEVRDLLSQWRGYSGNAGVSVGFSFDKLNAKATEYGFKLSKCIYSDGEKTSITRDFVERRIPSLKATKLNTNDYHKFVADFLPLAAKFKHRSFSEEQEWRLISRPIPSNDKRMKVRATMTGLVPYVEFDLKTGNQPLKSELQPWRTNEDICVTDVTVGPNRDQVAQMNAVGLLFDVNGAYVKSVGRSEIPYRMP